MVDLLRSSVYLTSTFAALQIDRASSTVAPQVQREKKVWDLQYCINKTEEKKHMNRAAIDADGGDDEMR